MKSRTRRRPTDPTAKALLAAPPDPVEGKAESIPSAQNILPLRPRAGGAGLSLGQFLRGRREAARKSVADIARVTRISQRTLQALETDDHEILPADVFVRGYLRAIARVCGFDGDEALGRYEGAREKARAEAARAAELAAQAELAARTEPVRLATQPDRRTTPARWAWLLDRRTLLPLLAALLGIAALVASLFVYQSARAHARTAPGAGAALESTTRNGGLAYEPVTSLHRSS